MGNSGTDSLQTSTNADDSMSTLYARRVNIINTSLLTYSCSAVVQLSSEFPQYQHTMHVMALTLHAGVGNLYYLKWSD